MKIISLVAENFKRLQAVEIRPDGNLVQITGKNGNGKTSVLDSLWVALAGKDACPTVPIRRGQERAMIRLDFGEIVVTRTFRRAEGDEFTTSISVENADGARYPSPQRMLDALLGELTFDPLAFARMEPKDQFDQLRRFVPAVDFDAIARANKGDFERRTEVNRLLQQEQGAAQAITVPQGTPEVLEDEDALVATLARAGEHNADIERRRGNRERAVEKVAALRQTATSHEQRFKAYAESRQQQCDAEVDSLLAQMQSLKERIEQTKAAARTDINAKSAEIAVEAVNAGDEANALQRELDAAGPLPHPTDVPALQQRIREAQTTNGNVRRLLEKRRHERTAKELEERSDGYTASIKKRDADKQAAIAAAKMPVPGIEFGDGIVLLNSVPFEQGSDAEQLRASVAIAMALNPKLRVLRIRDGSLLDEDSLRLVAGMADERDFQVWIEKVDSTGKVGFVLEDGHVRKAEASTEVAA